jgi:hypothetical protein
VNVRLTETTPLSEAGTSTSSGRWQVQAISAGKGSSGYYSPEVLEDAGKKQLIAAGTPLFFDHASESERHDRPERSVRDIAAVFTTPAAYDPTTQALVGEVQVFGPYRELVSEMAPHIGLSISGSATDIKNGAIEGLAYIDSVDLVTKAGRGGAFMSLLESARAEVARQAAESGSPAAIDEATSNDMRDALQSVVRDTYGADRTYVWVRDFDDSTVWFEVDAEGDCGLYGQDYTNNAGAVALTGDRTEVRVVTSYVTATRPDSITTTKESEEVPMGQIQIDEAEHQRLVEAAGRVDTLSTERDTEKARADAAEAQLAEAKKTARPRTPREVMEARDSELRNQVATLAARERARDIIAEELTEAWLPATTVARLSSELLESLPLAGEDMQLDEQGLRGRCVEVRDQHELEAAEALQAAGVGTPRGLGSLRPAARVDEAATEGALKTAFQSFGLSESAADTAAKGR